MGSRIDTLLNKFYLENRKYNVKSFENMRLDEIDFNKTNGIVEYERKCSFQYLKKHI